jgi:hypothetical protein
VQAQEQAAAHEHSGGGDWIWPRRAKTQS